MKKPATVLSFTTLKDSLLSFNSLSLTAQPYHQATVSANSSSLGTLHLVPCMCVEESPFFFMFLLIFLHAKSLLSCSFFLLSRLILNSNSPLSLWQTCESFCFLFFWILLVFFLLGEFQNMIVLSW